MTIAGRELVFQQGFLDALLELEKWAGQQDTRKGRTVVKRVVDFACDIIAPLLLSFPLYVFPAAPACALRRAIIDRWYAVIYEVCETELRLVYVYSTYQNLEWLAVPESE